jgi:murein DD-endopeptidase MepM/ murein hydrolase activator NlpD
MNNGKGDAGRGGRREINRTALTILGIVVIALIGVTVITLISMGKRLWGDVTGTGTSAVTDLVRSAATGTAPADTMPSLGNPAPESLAPATSPPGQGGQTPNPGNMLSGAESAPEAEDASADTGADAEASADDPGGDAAEVGAKPSAPVSGDAPEFCAPIPGAISKGHDENVAVYSLTMGDYRVHLGVDIEANIGDPVYSCADGVVSSIAEDPFMGVTVAISHGNGYVSYDKNLAPEHPSGVAEGMAITAGQIIGAVGESAILEVADSAHLHFELTVDGVGVNPADYIDFPQATAQTFSGE